MFLNELGRELETSISYILCMQNISPIDLFVISGSVTMLICIVPIKYAKLN